jgi:hypothetical protein
MHCNNFVKTKGKILEKTDMRSTKMASNMSNGSNDVFSGCIEYMARRMDEDGLI